jgi:orotidine-5'-phosphate decarboxylase
MEYMARLRQAAKRSRLCVGLDPVPEKLPKPLKSRPDGVRTFCEEVVRAAGPHVAAFKPNLAFFEALGRRGDEALLALIETARGMAPHALIIGDGKRGDIGSTAERYATALFDRWDFDAATVNPWFGADGVKPFAERPERGVYLLAATSNPSSAEVQEAQAGQEPLHVRIARLAQQEWNARGNLGLVVGATRSDTMAAVRAAGPDLPWLIPGVGAQGGDLAAALEHGAGAAGLPSLVNASRSVIYASAEDDYAEAAGREAKALAEVMRKHTG